MFRRHIVGLAAAVSLLAPLPSLAQPVPHVPAHQPAAAPAPKAGPGLEVLVPLALLVAAVGLIAHDH